MAWTKFGPGTVEYTIGGGSAVDFAQEVKSGGIQHSYEDVGEPTTYLDGTTDGAGQIRADSISLECDFDLGAAGFYNFLQTNDGVVAGLVFTPNSVEGVSWAGDVILRLPDGATAESFGSKFSGNVTHTFNGPATFTPATAAP